MFIFGKLIAFNTGASSVAESIDADAQAFITAASITDPTQQSAVNQLVLDLKAASIWGDLSIINPYVGASATSHRYNLKTATMDTTWNGGITHDSNGVTFNGTTGYGELSFAMTSGNIYNRSFSTYIRTLTDASSSWDGVYDGTNVFGMAYQNNSPYLRLLAWGTNNLGGAPLDGIFGMQTISVNANSANSGKYYRGSSNDYSATPNATPISGNFYIGALNSSGSPDFYNEKNTAFDCIGNKLTSVQVADLTAAVNTFQTTLSRNV